MISSANTILSKLTLPMYIVSLPDLGMREKNLIFHNDSYSLRLLEVIKLDLGIY